MIKKVAVLNGKIVHIYHSDNDTTSIPNTSTEDRDLYYTDEHGWREVGYLPPLTDKERIAELEQAINMILKGEI